jgi:hypothetical protein
MPSSALRFPRSLVTLVSLDNWSRLRARLRQAGYRSFLPVRRFPTGDSLLWHGFIQYVYTSLFKICLDIVSYINTLITQRQSAIVLAANDPNALIPYLKRAMAQKIKVVTMYSDTAPEGREIFLKAKPKFARFRYFTGKLGEACLSRCQSNMAR